MTDTDVNAEIDDMLGDLDESINVLDQEISSNEQQLENVSNPTEIDAKAATGLDFQEDYLAKMLGYVQSLPEKDRMKFLANLAKMKKQIPETNFVNASDKSKENVKARLRAKIQEAKMSRTSQANLKSQYEKSVKTDTSIGSLSQVPQLPEMTQPIVDVGNVSSATTSKKKRKNKKKKHHSVKNADDQVEEVDQIEKTASV
jgi:hypothetical protein